MSTNKERFPVFYHPSDRQTVWGRYWDRSYTSDRIYRDYPGIYQCARTKAPIVPPKSIDLLYKFAAIFLLPICVDKYCLMLSRKGDSLSSIIYGFIIPIDLFTILTKLMKAALSWEPIEQENVSLKEASDWHCTYRQKTRKSLLILFFCISLPLSLLIIYLYK